MKAKKPQSPEPTIPNPIVITPSVTQTKMEAILHLSKAVCALSESLNGVHVVAHVSNCTFVGNGSDPLLSFKS